MNGYLVQAYTLDASEGFIELPTSDLLIGIGMWLGTIMWFNVWFIIWPNQQKALNIGNKYPDLAGRPKAAVGEDRGHVLAASTRCSRSRCCSAWPRRRICPERVKFRLRREPSGQPGGSFV